MKVNFMNVPVDALSMDETVEVVDEAIVDNRRIKHVVVNAGKIVSMQTDQQLFSSVVSCDLINADGQSIVWAARLLGEKLPGRVAGADLMPKLIELASERNYSCYFLGAKEEIVRKVVDIYAEKYGSQIIAGYRNGYFSEDEEYEVAKSIAESGAQILFVAISSPKKEVFLHRYADVLENVNFTMGVGGTFDVVGGVTKRAPIWMQRFGLEWLYRLLQEPRRMWRRYLVGNTIFLWLVWKHFWQRNIGSERN